MSNKDIRCIRECDFEKAKEEFIEKYKSRINNNYMDVISIKKVIIELIDDFEVEDSY